MQVVIAKTPREYDAAARLLYEQYRANNIIEPNDRMRYQSQHARHGPASTFIAMSDWAVGTVTAFLDGSTYGLPANRLYSKELDTMGLYGKKLVEVGELALAMGGWRMLRELLGYAFWFAVHHDADIVATTHPDHAETYVRVAGFTICGPQKHILNEQPAVLIHMATDTPSLWQSWWRKHPKLLSEVLR